jgi:hypothetical protein
MQPIPLKPDAGAVARAERRSPGAGNHGDDVVLLAAEPLPNWNQLSVQKCSLRAPRQRKANRNGQHPFSDFFDLLEMVAAPGCVRLSCRDVGRKFAGDPGDPLARAPISRRFCPRSVLTGTGVRVGSIVHVDVGQDRDERTVACIGDALKCQGRIGKPR